MLPNKTVVTVLVVLLAGQVLSGLAGAQGTAPIGSDVFVERVEYGNPRIADVAAPINITIRNIGTESFSPPTGWQIFVGLNGQDESACITASQTAGLPDTFQSCYIRMGPGSNGQTIPAGTSRTYQLQWNADPSQTNTSAFMWVEILSLAESPGTPNDCTGPDTPTNCKNNALNVTGVRIDRLGVRATPDRDAREGTGVDANDAWRFTEIPTSATCPIGTGDNPQPVRRGCWTTPGTTLVTNFLVNNTGTIEDTYTPTITGSVYSSYLARGYVFSFAPPAARVNPGQSQPVRMSIFVPVNESAHEGININQTSLWVSWTSRTLATLDTSTPSPTNVGCTENPCVDPTLPTFIVGQRYQFNLTTNFSFDDADPAETSEFRINLTNLGNDDDRFNVSFVRESRTINDNWSPTIEAAPFLTEFGEPLAPGETHSVRLYVTPPAKTINGTYYFDVAVKSRGDTQSVATCRHWEGIGIDQARVSGQGPTCTVRFFVNVKQNWSISGTSDLARREVPGKTVTYNLVIRNEGNGHDTLDLNLASSLGGWDARLSETRLVLTPGNASNLKLTVTAPPNLPENTQAAFYVNTTSSGPPDKGLDQRSNVSLMSLFTIGRGPNIRLDAPTTRGFVDPGANLTFVVTATNIGNVADNFTIPLPSRPSDWEVSIDPPHKEVQPGESFPITVNLKAPNAAVTGENITATLRVASTVDSSLDAILTLEGNISGPDLYVDDVLVNTTTPYTRDPLEVTVLFGNNGNKAVDKNMTLRVFFVRQGVEQLIGERTYDPLDARQAIGAQRRLTETFVWDTSNAEGTGVILARVDAANTVREMDESVGSNEKSIPITFRRPGIRLDSATQGLEGSPGEVVEYQAPNAFTLTYVGDDPNGEPVTILVTSEYGWLTSKAEETRTLARGESYLIEPKLSIPRLPGTSSDVLTVTVVPVRRPAEAQRASITTSVTDEEKPIIKSITASPPSGELGRPVIITADIEDATGITSVTAYVTAPSNQTSAHSMTRTQDGKWAHNGTFLIPGAYRVTAEASDAADPPNTNTTRSTVGTFTMLPGAGPDIRLAAGQALTIRTGSVVKVTIRDDVGIAKASYAIRGVSFDMRAPDYAIDTSTFPDGPVVVNVTAENLHGVRNSATFSFTVDNTVPKITSVALDPDRPRAGDTVKVTIKADADVQSIMIARKVNGNVVQTENATRKTGGTFEFTFDAEEGDHRLDVTARDLAGNTNLADGAVVFSARPGSPLPLPTWVPILGLALVALALARFRPKQR